MMPTSGFASVTVYCVNAYMSQTQQPVPRWCVKARYEDLNGKIANSVANASGTFTIPLATPSLTQLTHKTKSYS